VAIANLDQLVEKARHSTLFSAPVVGVDLEAFLNVQGDAIRQLAQEAVEQNIQHIYWTGSGNSWLNLYSGKYLLDKFTTLPSDCLTSYELVTRSPARLNRNAWAFLASYSGSTEDTVLALRHARQSGARTIALVNQRDSLMGREADVTIEYRSKALYSLPMAAACRFALEVARLKGDQTVEPIIMSLNSLPPLLSKQYTDEEARARQLAEQYRDETLFYVLGTGPLWGLAYKFGLTVFMENMRLHGSFIDAAEFRHGPAEMLDRHKPVIVILKGTDDTRPMVERVQAIIERAGAPTIVYDVADYPGVHPLLAPFLLKIPLQWFAVYSALLRGIEDLDARALMGRGIMSQGEGITWP
jgi:fructoselysine-6-P-deglycase FrlB-like protein